MIETQQTNRYEVAEIALRSKLAKLADLASELIDLGPIRVRFTIPWPMSAFRPNNPT